MWHSIADRVGGNSNISSTDNILKFSVFLKRINCRRATTTTSIETTQGLGVCLNKVYSILSAPIYSRELLRHFPIAGESSKSRRQSELAERTLQPIMCAPILCRQLTERFQNGCLFMTGGAPFLRFRFSETGVYKVKTALIPKHVSDLLAPSSYYENLISLLYHVKTFLPLSTAANRSASSLPWDGEKKPSTVFFLRLDASRPCV